MDFKRIAIVAAVVVMASLTVADASAQGVMGDRRFNITAGSFFQSSETDLRIDGENFGTDINLEDDLGFSTDDSLSRFSFDWRFADKHMMSGGYYRLRRDASKRITDEIVWDDQVYPVDTLVSAEASLTFYEFSYTYWLMNRDRNALGITGGFVGVSIKTSLSAEPQQGGGTTEISNKANTDPPVVLIGASYRHKFGESFILNADATFLPEITYDNYTGSSLNLALGLEYEFLDHYGVGVAYNEFGIDFEAEGDRAVGKFEYDISGPQVYAKFFW